MGYDSSIILPKKTKLSELKKFLSILNYHEIEKDYFFYNNNNSEEHFTGVTLTIRKEKSTYLELHVRTTVWTTVADTEYTNLTLIEVSKRFGGYFRTKNGKNKTYKFWDKERRGAEAGCFTVFITFRNNLVKPNVFLQHLETYEKERPLTDIWIINDFHPTSIGINITVPFLISVFEEYFRSTFVVLLKWANNKKDIFKSIKINSEDLYDISEGITTVEKLASKYISFQNIISINSAFDKISKDIRFIHLLKSTKPERKYFVRLQELINFRHRIIHSNLTNPFYTVKEFRDDIDLIDEICKIFYDKLIEINSWNEREY